MVENLKFTKFVNLVLMTFNFMKRREGNSKYWLSHTNALKLVL